jgi:hypothetical protein
MTAFSAAPVNGGTTPLYQWSVNGVNVTTINPYHYMPNNGDVVKCVLTSNASCATTLTAVASVTVTVTPTRDPAVSITVSPVDTVCAGTRVTYTPLPAYGGSAPSYIWKRNNTTVSTASSYNYIPADGDSVSCVLISNYQCRTQDSAFSNVIDMTAIPIATPTVTITAVPGTVITQGQNDTLTATVVNGGPSPTYQWYLNGVALPGAVQATFIFGAFLNNDSVSCVVTSSGMCGGVRGSAYVIMHTINVGVAQVTSAHGDVKLVPNPNKGEFTIKGTLSTSGSVADEEVSLEVTDMLGQVVYSNKIMAVKGRVNEHISLGDALANGMYILSLHTASDSRVFHFVVEQ